MPTSDHRWKDVSGHRKQARENALTSWIEQKRSCKDIEKREPGKGTHLLERVEVVTGQDRKKVSKPARGTYFLESIEARTSQNIK